MASEGNIVVSGGVGYGGGGYDKSALSFDSEHRLRAENLCFDIDTWYNNIEPFTFKSIFVPLRVAEAHAVIAYNNASWRQRGVKVLSEAEVELLRGLEKDLDIEVDNLLVESSSGSGGSSSGKSGSNSSGSNSSSSSEMPAIFMRLCGRSPKDGDPSDSLQVQQRYKAELNRLLSGDEMYPDNANTKMIAIARTPYLKVRSGRDAMSLLLTSERCYSDLLDWVQFGEPEQVCLRLWEPDLTLDYEFRVFICKSKMTAISQYDHYTYYPYLLNMKDMLLDGIYKLWEKVHPLISLQTYVIDIAYLPNKKQFLVVELSPFSPCTGPACYHWQEDKAILENGLSLGLGGGGNQTDRCKSEYTVKEIALDVEFRLKKESEIHPQLDELISINWDSRWTQEKVPYDFYFHLDRRTRAPLTSSNQTTGIMSRIFRLFGFRSCINSNNDQQQQQQQQQHEPSQSNLSPLISKTTKLFVYGTLKSGFQWNGKYLHKRLGARLVGRARSVDKMALVVGDSGVPYLLGDLKYDCLTEVNGSISSSSSSSSSSSIHNKHQQQMQNIIGEVWEVGVEALKGLDDYEGLSKGYYSRVSIEVELLGEDEGAIKTSSNSSGLELELPSSTPTIASTTAVTAISTTSSTTAAVSSASIISADVYVLNDSSEDLKSRPFIDCYTLETHKTVYKPIQHIQVKQFNYFKTPSTWGKTIDIIEDSKMKPTS